VEYSTTTEGGKRLNTAEIRGAILAGNCDDDLDEITNTIKLRRSQISQNTMLILNPGDSVEINGIRPKYLNGLTAEVIKVNQTRVSVRFGNDAQRHANQVCTVPGSCVTPVIES